MTGADSDDSVVISPTGWVAQQAELYEGSGGTKGTEVMGAPCLLLDYKGRRTGTWRRTVLIYDRDGEDYLVVASNGGSDKHPSWYLNLLQNPDVRLRVGPDRFTARAETLSAQDKERVWPHLVELFPPYADYRKKSARDIPVIRLSRTDG